MARDKRVEWMFLVQGSVI